MTTRSPVVLKPSISTSSWLSVCSRSLLLSDPRSPPTASISSMKMIAGRCSGDRRTAAGCGGAEAGEHLDEGGRRLREEVGAGLVGDRLGQQRLAGAGRAVQEDALRDLGAELAEALGVLQELDDLAQLGLRLVDAGHLVPGDRASGLRLDLLRLGPRHQLHRPPDEEHERRP